MEKYKLFCILGLCILLLFSMPFAYSKSGTSKFIINQTTFNLTPGQKISEEFQLILSSGSTWGTSIVVSPSITGISIIFNPSSGDPTFSGTLTISVSNNTKPGEYIFNVSATGDVPTTSPTTIIVYVSSPAVTITTTTTMTSPPQTTSYTSPTTQTGVTSTSQKHNNYFSYVIIIMILLAIIIGSSLYYTKGLKANKFAITGLSVISVILSLYLIVADSTLRNFATIHYYLLIIYTIVLIALNPIMYITKEEISFTLFSIITGLFFIGMLIDSLMGMPFSSLENVGSGFSLNYFYGFGMNGLSNFSISFVFSSLLIVTFLILIIGIISVVKSKNSANV